MAGVTRTDSVLTVQGVQIPRLGFGTWQMSGRQAREGVRDALEIGYRHAHARDLMVTAYSPLAKGAVARDRTLAAIGGQHGKSASQVALRWLLDHPNVTAVPKASSHARRRENFEVFDFELSDADRERIAALNGRA